MKPDKPPYGSRECNGCGACCKAMLCPLGAMVFNADVGPCPALEDIGDRYACGLVRSPLKYVPKHALVKDAPTLTMAAELCIGVRLGCDSQVPGEANNPLYSAALRHVQDRTRVSVAAAFLVWLGDRTEYLIARYGGSGMLGRG